MLTCEQIRAGRALLDWGQEDLARAANVGIATIRRIEHGQGPMVGNVSTMLKIRAAFEKAGIRFVDSDLFGGVGVRFSKGRAK
jgi:predicted transcriptional regulator